MSDIKYSLTKEQMKKFDEIYQETQKVYPHLVSDNISIERTKTLIAYTILNDDRPIEIEDNKINVKEEPEEEEELEEEEEEEEQEEYQ